MADTYILIDASGQAHVVSEARIQTLAAERLQKGEPFKVYRAEPLKWEISLTPVDGGGGRAAPARKATGRRTRRTATQSEADRRVGRPKENEGPCRIPGCERPQKTRGLCSAHYQQHRRLARKDGRGLLDKNGNVIMRAEIAEPLPDEPKRRGRKPGKKKAGKKKATKTATRKGGRGRKKAATAAPAAPAETAGA